MKNFERTVDNFEGRIVPMLIESGFGSANEAGHGNTFFGPIGFYQAEKKND